MSQKCNNRLFSEKNKQLLNFKLFFKRCKSVLDIFRKELDISKEKNIELKKCEYQVVKLKKCAKKNTSLIKY